MPSIPMSAMEVLDRYFLEARCKLLEVAASLDRIDRADGVDQAKLDPRRAKLDEALEMLRETSENRAERLQMLFSREFDPDWIDRLDEWKQAT